METSEENPALMATPVPSTEDGDEFGAFDEASSPSTTKAEDSTSIAATNVNAPVPATEDGDEFGAFDEASSPSTTKAEDSTLIAATNVNAPVPATEDGDEFGAFNEASSPSTTKAEDSTLIAATNVNAPVPATEDGDEFGAFDEASSPSTTKAEDSTLIAATNVNAPVPATEDGDEFGAFGEAPTTEKPANSHQDDDWGDFDAAPSEEAPNDEWGDFDQVSATEQNNVAPLSLETIQKIQLETLIKLQKLNKFTSIIPEDQLGNIFLVQNSINEIFQQNSANGIHLQYVPSYRNSETFIKSLMDKNYILPESIEKSFQMSSLSQLNSMTSDWSCQQIHHLLLSTLPSDALDISELREPTFSKPSISFASLMQKRNQTTETQDTIDNQLDNDALVVTNDYQIESNRRFSLTENNYIASPTTTTTTTTTPTPAIGDNMKENDLYGNSNSGATSSSSSTNISISQVSANAGIGLSLPAQQYLKSLPDFSFMLIIPYVENGKE